MLRSIKWPTFGKCVSNVDDVRYYINFAYFIHNSSPKSDRSDKANSSWGLFDLLGLFMAWNHSWELVKRSVSLTEHITVIWINVFATRMNF